MIDDEIIESFLNCKYKAYLKYTKQSGNKTEFELLHRDILKINKEKFYNDLRAKSSSYQILKNFKWDKKHNIEKINYAIGPALQTGDFDISFDALEIRPPRHSLGRISYIPILISPREKVAKFEKIFLSIQRLILSKQRDITPEFGKIIYGNELKATKFKLDVYSKESERVLHELTRIISNKETPAFYQNNHCKICEFQEVCKAKLIEKDDLSLLGRFSQKEIIKMNNRGIFTVHQFSYTFKPRRRRKHPDKPHRFEYALKALSLREKQSYIQEIPKLSACKTEIYLDFEGLPDENFIYLIGIVIRESEAERQLSFWADSKEEEEEIFRQLFEFLSKLDDFTVYHYGSYEIKSLKKLNKKFCNKYEGEINSIIDKSFNILSFFTSSIYPPTYTNGLKDVAGFLGFKWSDEKSSGIQSIVWRKKWELSKDASYKNKLVQYNIEDCLALNLTKNWLACIGEELEQKPNGNFAKVEDLKVDNNSSYKFGIFKSINPDFETVNKCAYFDYQRNKIYLKTNRCVKKSIKRHNRTKLAVT
jgi:predicted RecB family nuclease